MAKMSDTAVPGRKLQEIARRELNETPDKKREGLSKLRQLISEEQSLHCPTEDAFLTKFLRARKYDAHSAVQNIKNYFRARKNNPELFDGLSLCSVPFNACCREHRLVTLSQHRDLEGSFVYMVKVGAWNTSICSLNDAWRLHGLYFEHLLLQDECQIMGLTLVLDLKGLGIHHVFQFTASVMRRILHILQDCFPVRLKGVYIVNNPAIFDIIFSIVKPFLKAKILQRIRFFGDDYDKMRAALPDDLIPEAKGGTHESYNYDKMARDLGPCEEFVRDIERYGYRRAT